MSHGPVTLGNMITSRRSPSAAVSSIRSSSTQGLSRLFTRVHSAVSPRSPLWPTSISPARASSFLSEGTASSRLPTSTSTWAAMLATRARMRSLEGSKKCSIRVGVTGISSGGVGAPRASGLRHSRGVRVALIGSSRWAVVHMPDSPGRRAQPSRGGRGTPAGGRRSTSVVGILPQVELPSRTPSRTRRSGNRCWSPSPVELAELRTDRDAEVASTARDVSVW